MNTKDIKAILKSEGFTFTKSLGQNFIFDQRVLSAIAASADIQARDSVLEIGPGAGTLTAELSRRASKVLCVEKDARLRPVLARTLADCGNTEVIIADFLKVDLAALQRDGLGPSYVVTANLPYYITTPILFKIFESGTSWRSITVMVQKEVAQRMSASPGSKAYGALSCAVGYYASAKIMLAIPRGAFTPPPDVDSVVIRLDRLSVPPVTADEALLFKVIHAAFAMRRKTLLNNLSAAFNMEKKYCSDMLNAAGIDPLCRGEILGLKEFADIANALKNNNFS